VTTISCKTETRFVSVI